MRAAVIDEPNEIRVGDLPDPVPSPGQVVVQVGVSVGERVAVDPYLFCGHCRWCRIGRGNLCEDWDAIGDTVDGAIAEYVAVQANNCHHLPDHTELQILGSMAVLNSYSRALRLVADRVVTVDPLLTHTVPIEDYPGALELVRRGDGVKVQILPADGAAGSTAAS
jgi:threonine dehydrogenase-like Zn-dependent dehydrogenase